MTRHVPQQWRPNQFWARFLGVHCTLCLIRLMSAQCFRGNRSVGQQSLLRKGL